MEKLITEYLLPNWPRKCVAILAAIIIWIFINYTIVGTKTIVNVPIRVINLPADKTVSGILANGILSKRINLSLNGTKDVIEQIEPGDLEVLLDASGQPDEWVVQLTKKHLVSLNPQIDLARHISQVAHREFVIKISRLVTTKIPVTVPEPTGLAPRGYEYVGVWPAQFYHTVSGSEEQINELQGKGFELALNLNEISKSDLDSIHTASQSDEVNFTVPDKWKTVTLPNGNKIPEALNDPEIDKFRIHFLRKQLLPLNTEIPIRLFYHLKSSGTTNPSNFIIGINDIISKKNGITVLTVPLYTSDVSHLFLDLIRNHIEITITAAHPNEHKHLDWSIEFYNQQALEDAYVAKVLSDEALHNKSVLTVPHKEHEKHLRERFREYLHKFSLLIAKNHRLELKGQMQGNTLLLAIDDE